ncbi:hypothetical protein [Plebeiibacterium marinum]|uniref:Uncharacterized protein n=1 Tax=Plebeiibacterium marinum TaxID=2992111 RepID=A0AAE3MI51_9BACT|nr:hypothetical protein [Plebeiobacterium marinum]MCW3807901.1 hypothetical protein [Plebeiobacterium marinum]
MVLKKIAVSVNLKREPNKILKYASQLAKDSNSKLSCICHLTDKSIPSPNNNLNLNNFISKLEYIKVIDDILTPQEIGYEIIITPTHIIKYFENITTILSPSLIITELTDLNSIHSSIKNIRTPLLIFHNPKESEN